MVDIFIVKDKIIKEQSLIFQITYNLDLHMSELKFFTCITYVNILIINKLPNKYSEMLINCKNNFKI